MFCSQFFTQFCCYVTESIQSSTTRSADTEHRLGYSENVSVHQLASTRQNSHVNQVIPVHDGLCGRVAEKHKLAESHLCHVKVWLSVSFLLSHPSTAHGELLWSLHRQSLSVISNWFKQHLLLNHKVYMLIKVCRDDPGKKP